jgi:hypothetical protein
MIALGRYPLIRSLPLYGAVAGGLLAAVGVVAISTETLESLVWTTGVAALVPAAAPPLGMTARALLALGSGLLVAALLWSSLFLLFGPGGFLIRRRAREDGVPVIRRADAHPDAPPRKPMSAADLGTPMMEVGVGPDGRDERTIPADLDLPLAAFDPKAILPVPMEPVRPVPPLIPAIMAPLIAVESTAAATTFVTAPAPLPAHPPVVAAKAAVEAQPGVALEPFVEAPPGVPPEPFVEARAVPVQEDVVETAAPTPIARPTRAVVEPASPPTIEALLTRLENGALRRGLIGSH